VNAFLRLWRRSSLVVRLLIASGVILMPIGGAALWSLPLQDARQAQAELNLALERTLQSHVERHPIAALEFSDLAEIHLKAMARRAPEAVPRWYRRGLGYENLTGNAPVLAGNRVQGHLSGRAS